MNDYLPARILIPTGPAEFRLTEKGSKFLGWEIPVQTEADAFDLLAARSRLHHDATHHCWAFRTGDLLKPLERSSDAGEPSGTAGRPILDAIKRAYMMNALVVVTRWFGGIKLGKGGLLRAYGGCAAETLKLVPTEVIIPTIELLVACPYDMIGWVEKRVKAVGGEIRDGTYLEQATLRVKLPVETELAFRKAVQDDGGGKVMIRTADLTD